MILSKKDQIEINKYFRNFVIQYKDVISFEANSYYIIKEIESKKELDFCNNWNYIMVLVLIIEKYYGINQIVSHDNYVGFKIENDTIQDKSFSKLCAYYLVCFKTLKKFWKQGDFPFSYENTEPFDEIDLM